MIHIFDRAIDFILGDADYDRKMQEASDITKKSLDKLQVIIDTHEDEHVANGSK